MIYTVGFNFDGYTEASIQDAINYLELCNSIGLDIETTKKYGGNKFGDNEGLDPYTTKVVMIQVGDLNRQFIIDARKIDSNEITRMFKAIIDRGILLVGHNLKFEFKHIYHNYNVRLKNMFDTMLAEMILTNGFNVDLSLKGVIKKYLKITVDKDIRLSFLSINNRDFNKDQIIYGAEDIILPLKFYSEQIDKLNSTSQMKCMKLECKFLEVLSLMEYNGFTIDTKAWSDLAEVNTKAYKEQLGKLTELLLNLLPSDSIFIKQQLDLFSSEKELSISMTSSAQVIKMFKSLDVECWVTDKKTKKLKLSLESKALKSYLVFNQKALPKATVEILREYIKLKEIEQVKTTFGVKFLKKYVNPITGKLHSNFKQIVSTGRVSSSNPKEHWAL